MKRMLTFLLSMDLLLGFASSALSTPYVGADIVINGADYSDIGAVFPDSPISDYPWFVDGTAIHAAWDTNWDNNGNYVEYTAYLSSGNWNIGLNAINFDGGDGGPLPPGYSQFEIAYSGDSVSGVFSIAASNTEVNNGYFNLNIGTDGNYVFRYAWTNDVGPDPPNYYEDANIQIISAFFDNTATPVPEPATVLLLGVGLFGISGVTRHKLKK